MARILWRMTQCQSTQPKNVKVKHAQKITRIVRENANMKIEKLKKNRTARRLMSKQNGPRQIDSLTSWEDRAARGSHCTCLFWCGFRKNLFSKLKKKNSQAVERVLRLYFWDSHKKQKLCTTTNLEKKSLFFRSFQLWRDTRYVGAWAFLLVVKRNSPSYTGWAESPTQKHQNQSRGQK